MSEPEALRSLDVLRALRGRHCESAGRAAVLAEWQDIDVLAVELHASRDYLVHGYEVKVSRSDWRRELAKPGKALRGMRVCDHWWLACPRGVATADELPDRWGMVEITAAGTRIVKRAPALRPIPDRANRWELVDGYYVPTIEWTDRQAFALMARRVAYAEADRRALLAAWPADDAARYDALLAGHRATGRLAMPAARLFAEAMAS